MGLDTTATHLIWFVAISGLIAGGFVAFFHVSGELSDAREAADALREARLNTRFTDSTFCYNGEAQTVTFGVINNGTAVVDVDHLTMLIDGTVTTSWSALVDDTITTLWLPTETLYVTVTGVTTEPDRASIVTKVGAKTFVPAGTCLSFVVVTPLFADVAVDGDQDFSAQGYDAGGQPIHGFTFTWDTDAGSIVSINATIGRLTAGTLAAEGFGVTATAEGVAGGATVNVTAGPVATVVVSPSTASVLTAGTQAFTAVAYDAYSNVVQGASFSWGAARGGVDASGLYTAPATTGPDTVTATSDGVDGTSAVTVTRDLHVDALGTYLLGVAATDFRRGPDVVETRITVKDHNGNLVSGVTVSIELSDPSVVLQFSGSALTSGSGVASISYDPDNGQQRGTWSDAVVNIVGGADDTYDPASNVVTSINFNVT